MLRSLRVVDAAIRRDTTSGPGWHRCNGDGYGDRDSDGRPWAPTGQGSGQRRCASGFGLIPEQGWENLDLPPSPFGTPPEVASIGLRNGKPVGSASPLTWSAAQLVRLVRDLAAGRLLEQPANTTDRSANHQPPAQTGVQVLEPQDRTAVPGSPVTVSGTSAPGDTVDVSATNIDAGSANTIVTTTAAADGSWSVAVPIEGGTIVLDVVATSPAGATAHQRRTVVFDFTPGTVLLDTADDSGDDNGPGTYAYPTSTNFQPGAFDIQRLQVLDNGTEVIFRLQTRNLSPTFGSPLGAQLVDVDIHDPAAADTSTAASFPQRNYQIAADSAWSRLIEVQASASATSMPAVPPSAR